MNPVDLVSSAPWTRVVLTTYALSLSFFEAVILDALLRGRARGALILSDLEGVRAALSEEGARRVGRDYEISPVVCNRPGVFHPKISVLSNDDDTHLLVGSGNLTFSGWGGNLEVIEHLHPSFAADAFDDGAAFFEALATSDAVQTTDGNACREVATDLRKAAERGQRNGQFRLLHSLDAPIAEQIALYAEELGGATRIAVASPYFDLDGNGISKLEAMTNCDNFVLHSHPSGSVGAGIAPPWPYASKQQWEPVTLSHLRGDHRRLHAKTMEVQCKQGRLLVAGSANATNAGLFGNNIEASVLRVQQDTKLYWQTSVGTPPVRSAPDDEKEADTEAELGVLHAKLEGDTVVGRILKPHGSGKMQASLRSPLRSAALGEIEADEQGQFSLSAAGFELDALKTGRLVLRLEKDRGSWEGFLSISVTLELIRRTGSIASKLIAMLGGTDTPEDVAAILAWFKEDPRRLPAIASVSGGGSSAAANTTQGTTFITLSDLTTAHLTSAPQSGDLSDPQFAWQRAMAMIRSSFVQIRGPWPDAASGGDDVDEDDVEGLSERASAQQRAKDKSRRNFSELLEVILDPALKGGAAPLALSLAHFLTDRIRPETHEVQSWVRRILHQVSDLSSPEADTIVATALLYHGTLQEGSSPIMARRFFLKRGVDLNKVKLDPDCIPAFIEVLNPQVDLVAELHRAQIAVTIGEQIHSYLEAAAGRGPDDGFDSLKKSPHWPRLLRALHNPNDFAKISVVEEATGLCPRKHILLPSAKRSALKSEGVAVCDCCGRVILNKDC
ncbi:hypothetical protein [Sagittula salina]|uniref:PLD phosphodiesterase domain-containing protein n=1 Tax=Sagittula salina TaxID=2820268 RepID=A0A940MTD9_9RHOB|nr:hypothetical protein [Sagittula salina]MBP0485049.1 hypothetical protein [Sagittula salina]